MFTCQRLRLFKEVRPGLQLQTLSLPPSLTAPRPELSHSMCGAWKASLDLDKLQRELTEISRTCLDLCKGEEAGQITASSTGETGEYWATDVKKIPKEEA